MKPLGEIYKAVCGGEWDRLKTDSGKGITIPYAPFVRTFYTVCKLEKMSGVPTMPPKLNFRVKPDDMRNLWPTCSAKLNVRR